MTAYTYTCPECGGEATLFCIHAPGTRDTDVAQCLECDWGWDEGSGEDQPPGFLESREEVVTARDLRGLAEELERASKDGLRDPKGLRHLEAADIEARFHAALDRHLKALTAALAEAAGLREDLLTAVSLLQRRKLNGTLSPKESRFLERQRALAPSPLAQAAAEVLEAVYEERRFWHEGGKLDSFGINEVGKRYEEAADRYYLALRRGEGEEG